MAPDVGTEFVVRNLRREDLEDVVRIDGEHTGETKPEYWRDVFAEFFGQRRRPMSVGLCVEGAGVEGPDGLRGYLLGEVRAVEFGSEPCGWVFAVGVHREDLRKGIATALLAEAVSRFKSMGVGCVRTMVRRNDVPILSFFRHCGFEGGPYAQLELDLQTEEEA